MSDVLTAAKRLSRRPLDGRVGPLAPKCRHEKDNVDSQEGEHWHEKDKEAQGARDVGQGNGRCGQDDDDTRHVQRCGNTDGEPLRVTAQTNQGRDARCGE